MITKLLVGISLLIFFVVIGGVVTYEKFFDTSAQITTAHTTEQSRTLLPNKSIQEGPAILTEDIVKTHAVVDNCWIIVNQNVYNMTSFLAAHPGGAGPIIPYCGKDASHAYDTKDKTPATKHTNYAYNLLKDYFIGPLGKPLVSDQAAKLVATSTKSTSSGGKLPVTSNTRIVVPTPATATTTVSGSSQNNVTLTLSEIATHNTIQNCWLIIANNVYNVSSYIYQHPGGVNVIAPYCGKEATGAFQTKGGTGSSHSGSANSSLGKYVIGSVGTSINVTSPSLTNNSSGGSTTSTNGGGGNTVQSTPTPIIIYPTPTPVANPTLTLTSNEIATHNTVQNCWIIISNSVYNVTSYLYQHPGGVNAISPYCGKDATSAFQTRGNTGSHSNNAKNQLTQYKIGVVGSSIPVNPTATPTPTIPATGGSNPTPTVQATPTPQQSSGLGTLPQAVQTKYPGATIKNQSIEDNGSQELEILYNNSCRHIKVNSSGQITSDSKC